MVLAFVFAQALFPMGETDLFFHLKLGDWILAHRSIPFRNLFSFTYPNHPDPDLAWAFQVCVAVLYRWGGFPLLVLMKAALVGAAFACVGRASRHDGASALATAAATILAILAASQRLVERPHLVTFLGLGMLQLWLARLERGEGGRRLWLLPALTVVWANFHAGVFFAPLVLLLWGVGAGLDSLRARRGSPLGPPPPITRRLALLWLAVTASTMATPAGGRLPSYLGWHTGLAATRSIEEFRTAEAWSDPWFFVLLALCVLTVLGLGRRTHLRQALPVFAIALLAFRSVRFVAEWALLAVPLCAAGFTALGAAVRAPMGFSSRERAARLGAAGLLATLLLVHGFRSPPRIGLDPDVVPFDAIAFATQHGLRERLYADLDVGCYLLWEGWPRFRVFQDARLPAYPDAFHRALDSTPLEPAAFDGLLRRYGVDAALLSDAEINMRAGSFDPDEWALILRTPKALIFSRRLPERRALIERYEIPLRIRFQFAGGAHAEPLTAPPARSPVATCEWQRRLATALGQEADPAGALDASIRALVLGCLPLAEEAAVRFRWGARLQLAGRTAAALEQYDRVLKLHPDDTSALVNRGFARLQADPEGARADFSRALALDPTRQAARTGLARAGRNRQGSK